MKAFIFSILAAACTTSAFAQTGNTMQMTCHINTSCSAIGECHSASEDVTFQITDKAVERHGEGTYELSYRGIKTEVQNLTMAGPWIWSEGHDDMQVLSYMGVAGSFGRMVWTASQFDGSASGSVKFLNCAEG